MWCLRCLHLTFAVVVGWCGCQVSDDVSLVTVLTPNGWHLTIKSDGSATYGYGAGGGPFLPPETFEFDNVVKRLQASLTDTGGITTHYSVSLRRGNERTTRAKYTKDAETVAALFETARQATKGPVPRLDELWERKPPVPTQPTTRPASEPASRPTTRATTEPAQPQDD